MVSEDVIELVKGRSTPGVLILGLDNSLLYSNREALGLLKETKGVPAEVQRLCEQVKGGAAGGSCALFWGHEQSPYSLRAFLIGGQEGEHGTTHVMVLVEKVAEQHSLNLKRARTSFGLSDREIEVVACLAQGLANKEIACKLFISQHTVKDHLKHIMRKMGVSSRSEIISTLK